MAKNSRSRVELQTDRDTRNDQLRAIQENDRRESDLEGCRTKAGLFQPVTKECPEYVKRIAKSYKKIRAARAEASPKAQLKSCWK